jgi:hypothetical protein
VKVKATAACDASGKGSPPQTEYALQAPSTLNYRACRKATKQGDKFVADLVMLLQSAPLCHKMSAIAGTGTVFA